MATTPVKTSDISKLIRPRPPLKEAAVKLSFEVHPQSSKAGVRVFPPPVGGTLVERKSVAAVHDEKLLQGFLPDHLALNPEAPQMDERLRIRRTFDPLAKLGKDQFMATTIFPPDQRASFPTHPFLGAP